MLLQDFLPKGVKLTESCAAIGWKDCNSVQLIATPSDRSVCAPLDNIDGLVQERHNSINNALELRLSHTKPSICSCYGRDHWEFTPDLPFSGVSLLVSSVLLSTLTASCKQVCRSMSSTLYSCFNMLMAACNTNNIVLRTGMWWIICQLVISGFGTNLKA